MKEEKELLPCPLCGRKAILFQDCENLGDKWLNIIVTTIRCEGKTYETKDIKGCNLRCSAANEDVAISMWNKRIKTPNQHINHI